MNNVKYVSQIHNLGGKRSQKQALCHVLIIFPNLSCLRHAPAEPFNIHMCVEHSRLWVLFLGVEVPLPCCGLALDVQPQV